LSSRRRITILGVGCARIGYKFYFSGSVAECSGCQYSDVCMKNLEPGRVYVVRQVKDKELPCRIHEGSGRVVEVEESDVEAVLENRLAIQDAVITFAPMICLNMICRSYEKCVPIGLLAEDRCKIVEVKEPIGCPQKLELVLVLLRRQPELPS